ncbi:hypothetical protein CMO91_00125 [Candidatus Woesearchaeota archaeon]|nr:hypothetical protein [Candidatus Woesearchaeota archaeon]|tara:strand:+ start:333 stop:1142 length:810 start_codon:yes stop_codon:yes gene_type:complete
MTVLVLLDIDGTLLNEHYHLTSKEIYSTIEDLQRKGVVFCLNSNRSKEDLIPIYDHFKLNGCMIGENGAFSILDGKEHLYADQAPVLKLKQILPERLTAEVPGSVFLFEDTVNFLKHDFRASAQVVLLANKFRKYTMSIHVRRNQDGHLAKDLDLTQQIADYIKGIIEEQDLSLRVAVSQAFGNVLVFPTTCDKGTTFAKVRDEFYNQATTCMISDDWADEPLINQVDHFYAVANAEDVVKAKAEKVATKPYTQGVVEILLNQVGPLVS